MKKVLIILVSLTFLLSIKMDAFANNLESSKQVEVEKLDNGAFL